ncbi:MAG TPA: hypothetical protein VL084_13525 [Thermoanaerobaculia bacterium]|nr:hypothetical protein [Thermoanaerobaculia bacterium]
MRALILPRPAPAPSSPSWITPEIVHQAAMAHARGEAMAGSRTAPAGDFVSQNFDSHFSAVKALLGR